METSTIEKLDKSRNNVLKMLAVGWTAFFGSTIAQSLITDFMVLAPIALVGLAGGILFIIYISKLLKLSRKINSDQRVKEALNNELHKQLLSKSYNWGFAITIFVLAILLGISTFVDIRALLVCQIALFVGILSTFVATMIYNRDQG